LTAREVQIADIVRDRQHLLNNGRYIKQTHLGGFLLASCERRKGKT
jgi:hypothetical protein